MASQSQLHQALSVWSFDSINIRWDQSGKAQAALNEGINEIRDGRLPTAIQQLTVAIETDEKAFPALYYRGVAYKLSRSYELAVADFMEFLTKVPDSFEGRAELGKVNALQKDYVKAERNFRKLIQMKPDDPRGHYYLGIYHSTKRELKKAQAEFQKSVSLDPGFTSGLVQLGAVTLAIDKDFTKGLAFLNEALKMDSLFEDARMIRYLVRMKNGETAAALEDIDFLVRYAPLNWRMRVARGYTLVSLQDYDQAFAEFRRVLQITAIHDSVFVGQQTAQDRRIDIQNLGIYIVKGIYGLDEVQAAAIRKAYCQLVVGDNAGAAKTVSSIKKESAMSYYILAVALEHSDDYLEAQRMYARVLSLDDDVFDAHKKRGIVYTNQGNWRQAIKDFSAMERINPVAKITYKLRGVAYFFLKDFQPAIEDFNRYLALDSTSSDMFYNRGITYMRMGNIWAAVRDCNRAKDYRDLDFNLLNREFDRLEFSGDSVALGQFIKLVDQIPQSLRYGTSYQVFLVRLMGLKKDWNFVEFRLQKLVTTGSSPDDSGYISVVLTAEASRLVAQEKKEKAIRVLGDAIKYDNRNVIAYFERGRLLAEKGESSMAKADLATAADLGDSRATKLLEQLSGTK